MSFLCFVKSTAIWNRVEDTWGMNHLQVHLYLRMSSWYQLKIFVNNFMILWFNDHSLRKYDSSNIVSDTNLVTPSAKFKPLFFSDIYGNIACSKSNAPDHWIGQPLMVSGKTVEDLLEDNRIQIQPHQVYNTFKCLMGCGNSTILLASALLSGYIECAGRINIEC